MLFLGQQNFAVSAAMFVRRYSGAAVAVSLLWLLAHIYGITLDSAYIALLIIVGLLGIIFLRPADASEFYAQTPLWQRAAAVGGMWLAVCGALLLLGFATKTSQEFSRRLFFTWAILSPLVILAIRVFLGSLISWLIASKSAEHRGSSSRHAYHRD